MNYLAHAYLSYNDPEILVGNMIGDHVKGTKALAQLPKGIRAGVLLHRQIDQFTDQHPATHRAKTYFRQDYRLYAGPFVDNLLDHFLANDPECFESAESLKKYTREVYGTLRAHHQFLPDRFTFLLDYMEPGDWLADCRSLRGIKRSFERMARRAQYLQSSEKAYETLLANYHILNQCYFEIMDDVRKHVQQGWANKR